MISHSVKSPPPFFTLFRLIFDLKGSSLDSTGFGACSDTYRAKTSNTGNELVSLQGTIPELLPATEPDLEKGILDHAEECSMTGSRTRIALFPLTRVRVSVVYKNF